MEKFVIDLNTKNFIFILVDQSSKKIKMILLETIIKEVFI